MSDQLIPISSALGHTSTGKQKDINDVYILDAYILASRFRQSSINLEVSLFFRLTSYEIL